MGSAYNWATTQGGNVYSEGIGIWIDLNQDGFFTAAEFMGGSGPALSSNGTFTIPYTAVPGPTRLRLRDAYYTTPTSNDACTMFSYGETEDYDITIIAPTPCSGTPTAFSAVATPTSAVCPGGAGILGLSGTYTVGGIQYQWQSSTVSVSGPWTSIPSGTNAVYNSSTLNVTTYYQAIITCTNSNASITTSANALNISGTTTNTVPYYEGFEGVTFQNQLPNCSWAMSSPSLACKTYTAAQMQNRVPRTGSKFASFYQSPAGTNYFYTNGIWLDAGVTYSTALWYTTEYYGYTNWSDLSIMLGTSQSTTGLVTLASTNGPAVSSSYKSLSNTFTVASSGLYYVAIKGSTSGGSAQYLSWDDLSITIPCSLNNVAINLSTNSSTICQGNPITITASGASSYTWNTGATTATITETPNSNVTYMVTGTNTMTGCFSTVSQNITVNPSPNVSIFTGNSNVCKGSSTNLNAYGATSYQWSSGGSNNPTTVTPSVTTSYTVIGLNSYGCSGTAVQQISVVALPVITPAATANGNNLCVGESVTLSATGANNYNWVSNNILVFAPTAVVSPNSTTSYTVNGTDANGCTGSANITLNVNACTGLANNGAVAGFNVYPNPNEGTFTVETANTSVKTIEVMDVTGRLIQSNTSSDQKVNFNLSGLANGIYYVKLVSDNTSEVVKIVKQ